jgi:large subunit ribosomal protein L23
MALLDRFKKKRGEKKIEKIEEIKKEEKKTENKSSKKRETTDKRLLSFAYGVIKAPKITEKATALAELNQYLFMVYSNANKIEVKKAVEALYGVKVEKVRIIHSPAKKRRLGKFEGWKGGLSKGFKKAIVSIAKGEKIEIMPR